VNDAFEAIVIGGGAAGLSAALTLGRSCRRVLVCDDGRPRNIVAERMHGFLTRDGTPPREMLRIAREQLSGYPSVGVHDAHVSHAKKSGELFMVRTQHGEEFCAKSVLLATGCYDALPVVEGLEERWGRTAFVCPYCDGWELRGKRIAAVGRGGGAVELAQELYQWSHDLVVCLQADVELSREQTRWLESAKAIVHRTELLRMDEASVLHFSDGSAERCDGVFFAAPLRQRYPLVDMLGCAVNEQGEIVADDRGRTGVHGVYAAGDAVTSVHQVILAAASGVCAAMAINEDLLCEEVRAMSS
jgi:thioredoxin reductase